MAGENTPQSELYFLCPSQPHSSLRIASFRQQQHTPSSAFADIPSISQSASPASVGLHFFFTITYPDSLPGPCTHAILGARRNQCLGEMCIILPLGPVSPLSADALAMSLKNGKIRGRRIKHAVFSATPSAKKTRPMSLPCLVGLPCSRYVLSWQLPRKALGQVLDKQWHISL